MRAVFDIALRDLRSRLRDRSAVVTAFVAPLGLAIILSLALGSDSDLNVRLAIADEDGGQFGAGIAEGIALNDAEDTIEAVLVADAEAVREAVDDGTAGAGLVVPEGTGEALLAGRQATLTVVRGPGTLSANLALAIARGVASDFERSRYAVAIANGTPGADPEVVAAIAEAALQAPSTITVSDEAVDGSLPNAASYFGPAMAVFFVFFVVGAGPQGLLRQRKQGSLSRLAAAPIPRGAILLGTGLSVFVLALASIATLWAVMSLGFGASWGPPIGVLILSIAITVAAAAITTLVATVARTEEQVNGWTSIIVFMLALLGGSFGALPPFLEPVSLATPNGLVLRGFVDLASGGGLAVVVTPLLGAVAFTFVALAIALPRADRLVRP